MILTRPLKYHKVTENILRTLLQARRALSAMECARTLPMDLNTITSHLDVLLEDGLIVETKERAGLPDSEKSESPKYRLTQLGRKYAVENFG